jgi:hypothetical protein
MLIFLLLISIVTAQPTIDYNCTITGMGVGQTYQHNIYQNITYEYTTLNITNITWKANSSEWRWNVYGKSSKIDKEQNKST